MPDTRSILQILGSSSTLTISPARAELAASSSHLTHDPASPSLARLTRARALAKSPFLFLFTLHLLLFAGRSKNVQTLSCSQLAGNRVRHISNLLLYYSRLYACAPCTMCGVSLHGVQWTACTDAPINLRRVGLTPPHSRSLPWHCSFDEPLSLEQC